VLSNLNTRGLSGARNTAVSLAGGDVIAFLDDDARADPDWLATMLPQYRNPDVIGVGGTVRPDWASERPPWFPQEFDWVVGCSYRGVPSVATPVRNLIGANMSLRRQLVAEVGGFSSDLGRLGASHGGTEETELCIRMMQRWPQRQILWLPDAGVDHLVTDERSRLAYFVRRCRGEGISKASVVGMVGSQGTATERAYVVRVLPSGITQAVRTAVKERRAGELARGAAILVGLLVTAAGYLEGRLRLARARGLRRQRRSA
jgi:hypothetical protein